MSSPIIEVNGISKRYQLGEFGYVSIKDLLDSWTQKMSFRSRKDRKKTQGNSHENSRSDTFWALKDVSFDVHPGEIVGIIGRNGAGKSTLLKVLSRITEPTSGEIKLRGRVASLLEVGTGFHPELTGRENIFLNGAILGMTRAEIRRKFDEIVAFAEVENFIDTPVKRYSSGMYVRLAFSVAAHLEPEILIVDEVLAVGDIEFQQKCMGKMGQVSKQGRTIIFVSHNMHAIERLCTSAILMKEGRLIHRGADVGETISLYQKSTEIAASAAPTQGEGKILCENEYFRIEEAWIETEVGSRIIGSVSNGKDKFVCLQVDIMKPDPALVFGVSVEGEDYETVFWSTSVDMQRVPEKLPAGKHFLKCKIPSHFLNEGEYRVEIFAGICFIKWLIEPRQSLICLPLSIKGGLSDSPYWTIKRPGVVAPHLQWTVDQ